MPTIVTTKSIVTSVPLLDAKTQKHVTEEIMFNGRKKTHEVFVHTQHPANAVITVEKELAKALIAAGHAREHLAGLDDEEVDPTLA